MDDARTVDERFWEIAADIGPIPSAPNASPRRTSFPEVLFFLTSGPLLTAVFIWGGLALIVAR